MPSQEVLAKIFKELSKKSKPLFRHEKNPDKLAAEGFKLKNSLNRLEFEEPEGLYWSESPGKDMTKLIKGTAYRKDMPLYRPNVTAFRLPHAVQDTYDVEDWVNFVRHVSNEPVKMRKELLKDNIDLVKIPDIVADSSVNQVVQLRKNSLIAKIKTDKGSLYRILGLSGAAAGATLGNEEDANAMPLGRFFEAGTPLAKRALQSAPSRTASKLIGETLEGQWFKDKQLNGKAIKNVTQGVDEKMRNIIFDDGTVQEIDAKDLSYIMAEFGNMSQINKFHLQPVEGKHEQAVKGLQHAYDRVGIGFRSLADSFMDERNTTLRNTYGEPRGNSTGVYLGKHYLIVPKPYAEYLNGRSVTLKNGVTGIVRMDKKPLGE